MTILMGILRRGVYGSKDRNGMVFLVRWSPLTDHIATCVILILTYVAIGIVAATAFWRRRCVGTRQRRPARE